MSGRTVIAWVLAAAAGASHAADGMPWDPFVNDCVARGETRSDCFQQLPPDLLAELEAYEAAQRELRRGQAALRARLNPGEPRFGAAPEPPADPAATDPRPADEGGR